MFRLKFMLLLIFGVATCTSMVAQVGDGPIYIPNRSASSYPGAAAARTNVVNLRGFSIPGIAKAQSAHVPRTDTVIGSQSYNDVIPILDLPGRAGLDLTLNLYYNSHVWDVDTVGNTVTFNADRDFPSYGFRLDFGYIEMIGTGSSAYYIVTEADGTKHALTAASSNLFDASDGTYLEYDNSAKILYYKNGATISYEVFPSQVSQPTPALFRPIQVEDIYGNFISLTYLSGHDQFLQTITDTAGHTISFNYDINTQLSSITQAVQPSVVDPSGIHTYATFSWGTLYGAGYAWYSFSPFTVSGTPPLASSLNVLTGCTYANGTGYQFGYGDWGVVNKITNFSSTGNPRNYVSYNYPLAAAGPLADSPAFTQQTVSPDGLTTNTSVWTFATTKSAGLVTSMTVTAPPPLNYVTVTNINGVGLTSSIQEKDGSGTVLKTVNYTWASGLPATITTTLNDTGQQSSIQYAYDLVGNVGNPSDIYEYDFGMVLKRHTVTTYLNGSNLIRRILTLPTRVVVKDGAGNTISRTDMAYDGGTLAPISGASHHDDTGHGTTFTVRGNLTSVIRYSNASAGTGGITRTFSYDTLGNLITAQLDCCNTKSFNFSAATQFIFPDSVVRGPSGLQFTSSSTYDTDRGLLLASTDESGQTTQYQYDSMNRRTVVSLPPQSGTVVQLNTAFDDAGASPTITSYSTNSGNTGTSVSTLDGLDHLMQQDNKDGSTVINSTTSVYDKLWRQIQISNPFAPGETPVYSTITYDALSRPLLVSPPSGGYTQYQYLGNTVTVTDPAGKQRKNYTDALGRLVEVDEPGWGDALKSTGTVGVFGSEGSVCTEFGVHGCLHTVFDRGTVSITVNGATKSLNYNSGTTAANLATSVANAINTDHTYPVTAAVSGTSITLTSAVAGASTNYSLSSTSATLDPADFSGASFGISAGGTLSGGIDGTPEGSPSLARPIVTTYAYDVFDNLTAVSLAAMGPVSGVTYSGQPRSYTYDSLSRVTSVTTPESGTIVNYYSDVTGNSCSGDVSLVCRIQDARGVIKTLSYDAINRLISVQYSDGTQAVSYSYVSGIDRLSSITEGPASPTPVNSQTFGYDSLGRVTSVNQTIDQVNYLIQYSYNLLGQGTTITYPSGRVVTQSYDSIGRTASIASAGTTYLSGLSYNANGQTLGMTLGNGVQGQFTYNDHLQIQSLRYSKVGLTPDPLNLSYDYTSTGQPNNNGQIQAVHYFTQPSTEDQTRSEIFSYDAWLRLKAAQTVNVDVNTPGTWSLGWAYDRLGNRKQQTLTGGNLPGGIGQPNFTIDENTNRVSGISYDPAGNITGDGIFTYAYDGAGRMKQAQQVAAPNTITSSTYFGPMRIKKAVGPTTTTYIYAGSKPIAEYINGSSTPSNEYIYAGSTLMATVSGTNTLYHHPDHLSNRAETDATGAVVRSSGHFPYGEVWYESASDPTKFTSYKRDAGTGESGLDYATFRYYSSGQGRFAEPDLLAGNLAAPQSLNKYAYVGNDAVNLVDPYGLSPIQICFGVTTSVDVKAGDQTIAGRPHGIISCTWLTFGGDPTELPPFMGGGAPGGGPRDPRNPAQPLYCNSDFQRITKAAFAATNNGQNQHGKAEAGFAVSNGPNFSFPFSLGANEHLAIKNPWGGNTLAVVHTHGNAMSQYPSTDVPGIGNIAGGDVYSKVPNYVYSERNGVPSLYVTDPTTHQFSGPLDMDKDCNFSPGFSKSPSESYT